MGKNQDKNKTDKAPKSSKSQGSTVPYVAPSHYIMGKDSGKHRVVLPDGRIVLMDDEEYRDFLNGPFVPSAPSQDVEEDEEEDKGSGSENGEDKKDEDVEDEDVEDVDVEDEEE